MSIKDLKFEQQIESINEIIENIRRIKTRLDNTEVDLIDLQTDIEKTLHKM